MDKRRNKKSGHIKLKSSGQLLSTPHNFQLAPTELPESFFENIVFTEFELSEDFSMDKFEKLIQLYSEAIEFYSQNDPSQSKYYKGRMESLFTKRDTLIKLKKQGLNMNISKKEEKSDSSINNNNLNLNNNNSSKNFNKSELKQNIELRKDVIIDAEITNQVNKVMNVNNNAQNKTGIDIIKEDLKAQNEKWKEKLKRKKKNMLSESYNIKMKHQKGMSLDLINSHSSDAARNNNNKNIDEIDLDKFNKMKNLFSQDIFEEVKEVKEENEEDGNENENNIIELNNNSNDLNNKNITIDVINEEKNDDKIDIKKKDEENEKKEEKEAEIDIDEKILTSVNEKMDLLMKLIDDIENNKLSKEDEEETILERDISYKENNNEDLNIEKIPDLIKVPLKFQTAYFNVENLINQYISQFNNFFFKEIFEQFALNLKDIYDTKYKKYIEVSLEYHHQIKENEHILENHADFSEEKKEEIQTIIDSLKDEQQNQIAKIEDEFNRLIVSKVNEFKIDSFKNNSGILLIEEKLKLDIYSIINESFYRN